MKISEEFKSFYEASLLPILETLEQDRKKLMRKMRPFLFVLILFLGPIIFFVIQQANKELTIDLNDQQKDLLEFIGLVGVIGFWPFGLVYWLSYRFYFSKKIGAIKARFKTEVIGQMIKFIDQSLLYHPHNCISEAEYHQSQLFLTQVDRYWGDDLISGKLGSTAIKFSEVRSMKRVPSSDKNEKWKWVFNGLFFVADFNKNFSGRTIVMPDLAENLLGSIGTMFQKLDKSRGELIKMENVEFEKAFAVYGTDAVEAHYLLSPSLMTRVVDFRKKSGKIYFSFIDSKIFIAIPLLAGVNLFEPRIYRSIIHYKGLVKYNNYLLLLAGIVEDLNLNTRIWTKK